MLIILNDDLFFVDEVEIYYAIPVTLPIILLLVILSKRINRYSLSQHLNNEIEGEINDVINKISDLKVQNYQLIKRNLSELKNEKAIISDKQYLKELIKMKKNLMGLD